MDNLRIPHSSPWITSDDISAVNAALDSKMIAHGSLSASFENQCAEYLGMIKVWSSTSGRAALKRALRAMHVGVGSEVIVPTYVCDAVAFAILALGATPVYADVGENWCITANTVSSVLTSKTAAIVVVHPFGIIADTKSLLQFSVPVIEDCCQCFCPDVGKIGAAAIYSLHATKCLTSAEGGLIATAHPAVQHLLEQSYLDSPDSVTFSDMQAALAISQLKRYSVMLERRKFIAATYFNGLPPSTTKRLKEVRGRSIFFRFPLSVTRGFNVYADTFERYGISVRRGVDQLLHRKHSISDQTFPVASELYRCTLSIPIYPSLDDEKVSRIIGAATAILA